MQKVIRKSVFETNSSSSHSIYIYYGDEIDDTIVPRADGVVTIFPGEFGWEIEDYYDAASKAAYALTWAKQANDDTLLEQLERVVKRATGAKMVEFLSLGGYYEWGYIDHQSGPEEGGDGGAMWESDETLMSFIFNKRSCLHTDHDNH